MSDSGAPQNMPWQPLPPGAVDLCAVAPEPPPPRHAPLERGALGAWWREGVRTALFMRPRWSGLQVAPVTAGLLALASVGVVVGMERLQIMGPAHFHWPALLADATWLAVLAWLCWLLVPASEPVSGDEPRATVAGGTAPGGTALWCLLMAQSLPVTLAVGLSTWPMATGEVNLHQAFGVAGAWGAFLLPLVWVWSAQALALWRGAVVRRRARLAGCLLLAGLTVLTLLPDAYARHWYPAQPPAGDDGPSETLVLTQELMELQPRLLTGRLDALQPQRPGRIDVYAITFAPYAGADVFKRESAMVAGVMQQRFGAEGRVLQLVNHPGTAREWPWATPLNLQRTIAEVARRMDLEQDVLFIHFTSHGARSGELAAEFWPLSVEPVTPALLKAWLDEAGVRHRILSISACFSGSWVAPLAGPDTLVMTAADAEHTSYGCGRRSELTFFGRAMYDEQLRHTRSFEQAHAAARTVIEQREKDAGKDDGYSNPQIAMGERLRARLETLARELERLP
jgi:hypothetical protein